ncbi:MAG: hypothetical protein ABJ205_03710 [Erythrobacter sp.]|uniref:hypothetical protein n=1 Tax=Erythrobacter sp. TaxID=1042 RepID=UPI003264CCF0
MILTPWTKKKAAANTRNVFAAALLSFGFFTTTAFTQSSSDFVEPSAREVEPARPLAAIVPQERIATSIDLGRIVLPGTTGGILGSLLISAADRTPEKLAARAAERAERFARPLAAALEGFDVPPLADKATSAAASEVTWFASGPTQNFVGEAVSDHLVDGVNITPDSTVSMTFATGWIDEEANDTRGAAAWNEERKRLEREFLEANFDAGEVATVTWRYQLSSDFTNIQVIADMALRRKGSASPHYEQQLISIVKLRHPTFVEEENVAIWAANDAAFARLALTLAFERAGEVLPSIIALDEEGMVRAMDKKRKSVTSAGFHGPELFRDDKGSVFFARDGDQRLKAFVTVQTIRNR